MTSNSASGSGSIGINWSQLFQSQGAGTFTVSGFDIGMNFGNGNTDEHAFLTTTISSTAMSERGLMDINFTASANQNSVTGGTGCPKYLWGLWNPAGWRGEHD